MPHASCGSAACGSRASPASPATPTATPSVTRSPTRCWARRRSATSGSTSPTRIPPWKGSPGCELLRAVLALLRDDTGLAPVSCDVTVLCERPAIEPRREEMRATLAGVLEIPVERMSVKATRPEGLGLSGDGVGCFALATLR